MAHKPVILMPTLEEIRKPLPKIKAIHPYGAKLLVEILRGDEILGTNLHIGEKTDIGGAPQALIIEMGPCVPAEAGLQVGQRIYWSGKGTQIEDPNTENKRVRALLEINNILAIIEEV